MTQTLYENRPGGTIVRLADGTSEYVAYGQPYTGKFAPENLLDIHANELEGHADGEKRYSDEDLQVAQAREAHARAALDGAGQPNSSQSPVPGNYGELDENAASQLVAALAAYPSQQASVLYHEILFGGNRRRVIDAASEQAHLEARMRIAALTPTQKVNEEGEPQAGLSSSVASAGDPDRLAATLRAQGGLSKQPGGAPTATAPTAEPGERYHDQEQFDAAVAAAVEARLSQSSGDDRTESGTPVEAGSPDKGEALGWDGRTGVPNTEGYWTKANLETYAAQHNVDVSGASNRDQLKAKLAIGGHPEPQTPKPE